MDLKSKRMQIVEIDGIDHLVFPMPRQKFEKCSEGVHPKKGPWTMWTEWDGCFKREHQILGTDLWVNVTSGAVEFRKPASDK